MHGLKNINFHLSRWKHTMKSGAISWGQQGIAGRGASYRNGVLSLSNCWAFTSTSLASCNWFERIRLVHRCTTVSVCRKASLFFLFLSFFLFLFFLFSSFSLFSLFAYSCNLSFTYSTLMELRTRCTYLRMYTRRKWCNLGPHRRRRFL